MTTKHISLSKRLALMLNELKEFSSKRLGVNVKESEIFRALIVFGYENKEDLLRYIRKIIIEGV